MLSFAGMRGDLTIKILEAILEGAVNAVDVLAAIAVSGMSSSRINKTYGEIHDSSSQNRRHISTALYKLKRDGILLKNKRGWSVTKSGKEKLRLLSVSSRGLPTRKYIPQTSNHFSIVIFDIPEKHRYKRNWLRHALVSLGFTMLQKSAWIGKIKIPSAFIKDLGELKLLEHVEIFTVVKQGTIEKE